MLVPPGHTFPAEQEIIESTLEGLSIRTILLSLIRTILLDPHYSTRSALFYSIRTILLNPHYSTQSALFYSMQSGKGERT
jgi:hypothetical protein